MKKILFFSLCMSLILSANAQYWQIPNVAAGMNPGDLNNDTEQPSPAGWTSILATSASPTWSAATSIPFSFQFNGTAVTQFKASSTGVVTFDVASTIAAPTASNVALPSAMIPDNSVCAWGITGTGANDNIVTKTFGTAPNRQFWIQYSSFSYPGNAAAWCYWSIVLEETTNKIHIVDHRSSSNAGPVTIALTAGIQINSTTAYSVAGSPALNTASTTSADDPSDNSFYTFLPGTQPTDDLTAVGSNAPDYVTTGTNLPIDLEVRNYGSNPVTSYTIKYQDGTNPVVSQNVTGVNIASLAYNTTTFTTPYSVSSVGAHDIKVWVELTGDANNSNDTVSTIQSGVGFIPKRVVTMEEPTGTWCGWCTRGIVYMDSIHHAQPNDVAVIAVHNNDPMVVSAYDSYIGGYIGGYPSLVVDRKFSGDPSDAFSAYNALKGDFGFADITQTNSFVGSNFTVDVDVKPATDLTGDYRLGLVVIEDGVQGSGSSWDQANYYSFQSQNQPLVGGGVDYQAETNPIPASKMTYNHVARAVVGTPQGQSGSLPASMTYNQTYSYSFNYAQPNGVAASKMTFVVLLLDYNTGEILNASYQGAYPLGSSNLINNNEIKITAYPNPVVNTMAIDMELKSDLHDARYQITDMLGKVISNVTLGNVAKDLNHTYKVDVSNLTSGTYFLSVKGTEGSYSTKFVKK